MSTAICLQQYGVLPLMQYAYYRRGVMTGKGVVQPAGECRQGMQVMGWDPDRRQLGCIDRPRTDDWEHPASCCSNQILLKIKFCSNAGMILK